MPRTPLAALFLSVTFILLLIFSPLRHYAYAADADIKD